MAYKRNIDAGTLKTSSELLFSLLLFSFPVFLFFLYGECFHETFNPFWSTYRWGASNNTSMLPISDFYQVTRQLRPLRSCGREMSSSVLCIKQNWERAQYQVGRNMAIPTPLSFLRLLERALWEWHTLNDFLTVFARKTFFLWSACTSIITRYSSQYTEQVL